MSNIHAAFILCFVAPNQIAATTRPTGGIGLPGGKLEAGEDALTASLREAYEEGWAVRRVHTSPIHQATVEGKLVVWFLAEAATKLDSYPEKGRVTPIVATRDEIVASGFGNEHLPFSLAEETALAYLDYLNEVDITEYEL